MENQAREIWQEALILIREKVNPQSFKTWLRPTEGFSLQEDLLVIKVPNPFFADWIGEHYCSVIQESVEEIVGRPLRLSYQPTAKIGGRIRKTSFPTFTTNESALQERFTFETFVVGDGNRFAHAAALAVAEAPGETYNPLFIFGGVGLGKTHLTHAIGNFVRDQKTEMKPYFTSTEMFLNEMIDAIQNRQTISFKNKYRSKDLLLIDDIHFLADKESLQEEIFHTFNALYDAGRQIVVTSDRPPKDIPTLEERLISRFQWGLVVDIQPPDLATRIAILKDKAERDGFIIPVDVAEYIAQNVKSNIRHLEGCLIRLQAFISLTGEVMSLEVAREVLRAFMGEERKKITVESVQKIVADYYDLSEDAIRGKRRTAAVALPRQIAMYLTRELTGFPLKEIGKRFGGKDHTTILHACNKIDKLKNQDRELKITIEKLIHNIQNE
ncbi:chromosomal replication initiator protein DnaA [candidate division TA06 bacterium]|nr:chromosomal replication initiator protein DnaA [candidate division TA06 bacterium]